MALPQVILCVCARVRKYGCHPCVCCFFVCVFVCVFWFLDKLRTSMRVGCHTPHDHAYTTHRTPHTTHTPNIVVQLPTKDERPLTIIPILVPRVSALHLSQGRLVSNQQSSQRLSSVCSLSTRFPPGAHTLVHTGTHWGTLVHTRPYTLKNTLTQHIRS